MARPTEFPTARWPNGSEAIVKGQKMLAKNLEDIFRTFPDWKMEVVEMAVDGESVIVRCRVSGTHGGVVTRAVELRAARRH